MFKKQILLLLALFIIGVSTYGQAVRGFYLTGLGGWLNDQSEENDILEYAQGNGFNYILLYDLGDLNWNSSTEKNQLAAFIKKAKTQYGIDEVGGVVEYEGYAAQKLIPYNNTRNSSNEKFDVINMEFEFWVSSSISNSYCSKFLDPNGYSCDKSGAWAFAWSEFKKLDDLCAANGLISEYYLGWPDLTQMQKLAGRADRLLLSAYRPTDSDIYTYSKQRLKDIASIGGVTKVHTLMSAQSSFMGPWLNTHPQTRPYQTISAALAAETGSFKNNINMQGYHWFTYKYMPKTHLATASISASGPLTFCPGGSVTLTANSGTDYLWSPGGQTTRSITVSSSGSYTVRVTHSSGLSAVSSPAVVSNNGTGGTLSFCPGGSVTLSTGQSSTYLWSTGATTQSITVSASGTYTVTTGGSNCSGTSNPVVVNANAAPAVPSITSNSSLNICPGTVLTLTSSPSNGYLWSNGATTRSIVVNSAGTYSVRAYSGPNCSAQSSDKTVTILTAPSKPVIGAKNTTVLTSSNPTVTLTSTPAVSYLWSNGEITKTVSVNTQGNYRVIITGTNGCTATSNDIIVSANGCIPPPVPTISVSGSTIISSGQNVTLTASSAGGYLWSNGAISQSITVTTEGSYSVRVYNAGGCFSNSLPTNVTVLQARLADVTFDLENTSEEIERFSVYPNPASELLNISFTDSKERNVHVLLVDLTGRELLRKETTTMMGENKIEMNVSDFTKGVYFAYLLSDDNKQVTKVIIE
jgi:Secretion system C-terminal sorting domain